MDSKHDELDVCLEDVAQEFKFEPVKVSKTTKVATSYLQNDIVVYSLDSERTGFIAAGFI